MLGLGPVELVFIVVVVVLPLGSIAAGIYLATRLSRNRAPGDLGA